MLRTIFNTFPKLKRCVLIQRFMSNVVIGKDDDCWEWTGRVDQDGYGLFSWKAKKIQRANIAAYVLFVGKILKHHGKRKLYVCHSCDNPICVNPNHLFLGTCKDNMDDMYSKYQGNRGEGNSQALLTLDIAKKIRKYYKRHPQNKTKARCKLAKKYNVSECAIQDIVYNRTWVT